MKLDERHVDIIRAALKEIQVDPEVQDAWQHALAEKNRHNPPARLGLTAEQERQLIANIGKHYANAGEEVSVKEIAEALQSAGILAHGR
ncbi:MAG: hypothetical protein JO089_07420, partial [Alphaproteobacteria bacterium]|nr:hypothetical protein [Alphaproteobacteria bacterium]